MGDLYETENHLKKFIMSQSINNDEFNLESVEQFIQERESKKEGNFSFKKDNEPSDNENVFDEVLGKTFRERN